MLRNIVLKKELNAFCKEIILFVAIELSLLFT